MKIKLQQPDYRNDGKFQFVVGYTGGFAAPMCVHLTPEEYAARARARHGEGDLIEINGVFYWKCDMKLKFDDGSSIEVFEGPHLGETEMSAAEVWLNAAVKKLPTGHDPAAVPEEVPDPK